MREIKTKIKNFMRKYGILSTPDPLGEVYSILAKRHNLTHTVQTMIPTAPDGSPVPWYTFPAIEYFQALDAKGLDIFEYGCGNSSLFWAQKGANVWCVEHDPEWHKTIYSKSSDLRGLLLKENKTDYANAIHETIESFDIIIIDGIWRNECAAEALTRLKPGGLIILDNSDWYTDVAETLRSKGFFQVDFNGFGPCNRYCWTTSMMLPLQSSFMNRWAQPAPIGGICTTKTDKW